MKTKERFEEWFSTGEEDFKKYKWLQWMNDIQEEYLSWYNDLRDNTIEETEEWSTRDDENLEKWALYEEYKILRTPITSMKVIGSENYKRNGKNRTMKTK